MKTPFTIEHVKKGNYLRIVVTTPITRELADELLLQSEELFGELGVMGELVDTRGVSNPNTVNDNVEVSAWDMKEAGTPTGLKRAILTDADDDTYDLPILAMRQEGFNARRFTDESEAIAWLTGVD